MSEKERVAVEQMLRSGPDFSSKSFDELRIAYEAIGQITPPPQETKLESIIARGVSVEIGFSPQANAGRDVLYFHGGGYNIGSSKSHRGLTAMLGIAARSRTISVDYRLAPEHPFPAAVDDAMAVYRWLLDQHSDPTSIAFAGDSAGAGLAVATMVRARDEGLKMPAAAVLFSPFVDLLGDGASMAEKAMQDASVSREIHTRFCTSYLAGADPKSKLASPIYADLRGLPPLLVHVGTSEALLDDAVRLFRRAAIADVSIELKAWSLLPHVWQLFAAILEEGRQSIDEAGLFLLRHLASA